MILQALGINRIEANRISALTLPDVPVPTRRLGQVHPGPRKSAEVR
jgi:hypothetical protein